MKLSFAGLFDDGAGRTRQRVIGLFALLIAANVVGWTWAFAAFASDPLLLGTALLAWVFGLRHAVDADHIAAIDNVVRKLMQDGKRPLAAGFFFSLGHSTVVVLAVVAIAAAAVALQHQLTSLRVVGGVIGTGVSAAFLLLVAVTNVVILAGVWRQFRRVSRGGAMDSERLDVLLAGRGLFARALRPLFAMVTKSWHMYPLGFLFGLGFDTATEVGLLAISASQAARGMSPWEVLVFPALFTAGMALVDSADSVMMVGAYGWAFINPIRKLWYNLTITAASVAVALLIGGVEAFSLIADRLGLAGGFWTFVSGLNRDLTNFGFLVVGIFAAAWAISALILRWKGYGRLVKPAPPMS